MIQKGLVIMYVVFACLGCIEVNGIRPLAALKNDGNLAMALLNVALRFEDRDPLQLPEKKVD